MADTIPMQVYETIRATYIAPEKIKITCKEDLLQIKKVAMLSKSKQEEFLTITLDGASQVIKCRTITKGLLNHSLVHPREVFRDAILDSAATIICIHNHPSGNLEPSSQDVQITGQIKSAGEIIGISLLDHVIVSSQGVMSMRQCGYI